MSENSHRYIAIIFLPFLEAGVLGGGVKMEAADLSWKVFCFHNSVKGCKFLVHKT